MTQSLKASKQVAHSPSKVEVILNDNVKLALASVTGEGSKAFELYAKQQDASVAYDNAEELFTNDLYSYLVEAMPDYATFQAIKKHIINSIATAKGRKYDTIEKWLNDKVIKAIKALGYELPKAESKSAQGMAKLRSELSVLSDSDLTNTIETLKSSNDYDNLKQINKYVTEKQKREKAKAREIEKRESSNTKDLKNTLKKFITGLDSEGLAAMLYVKNHFNEVKQLAKATK